MLTIFSFRVDCNPQSEVPNKETTCSLLDEFRQGIAESFDSEVESEDESEKSDDESSGSEDDIRGEHGLW